MSYGSELVDDGNGVRMRHGGTRKLYAYWNRLRSHRPAPERSEVEPGDIGSILSDTFILEVLDDGLYPYRLAGTRVCSLFGHELKGDNWLDGWKPRDREALATLLRSVVSDAAGAIIEFDGRNMQDQSVPFETLLLPLASHDTGYRRILGATLPLDEPYWLGTHAIVESIITGLRLIWPHKHGARPSSEPAPPALQTLPLRRLRHLALYEGGQTD